MRLPDAEDLFRPTPAAGGDPAPDPAPATARRTARAASGRVKHDEKMTVYVTADELHEIEDARLALRRQHGLAVDRGRLVREAVALVLADLDRLGAESPLVRRLGGG